MCAMDYVPFTYSRVDDEWHMIDFKAIFQGLIVAAVTGFVVMYGTQNIMTSELKSIHEDIQEIKANQAAFRKDFYRPLNR